MKYTITLGFALLILAGIPVAHANIPLMSPMGMLILGPIINAAALAMIIEVIVVLILLRNKSLKVIRVAFILFFANIISFTLFLILLPSLFAQPPDILIVISETLVIIFEALVLSGATKLTIFRKPEGLPLTFKAALVPVMIGNITSIALGLLLYNTLFRIPPPLTELEISVSGQGTWEETLEARDFDGNRATIEAYYDTVLNITWLADANYSGVSRIWSSANNWIDALDVNGNTGWRLPLERPIKDVSTEENEHLILELNHLYYVTLGNKSGYRDFLGEGLTNTGPFLNVQKNYYWTGTETVSEYYPTEHHLDPTVIVTFNFGNGGSSIATKNIDRAFVWAVHDGDVGSPIPK